MKDQLTRKPTPAPRWIISTRDLPAPTSTASFTIAPFEGETYEATLSKRKRQIFAALVEGSIYCASCVRISDVVMILKRDHSIPISTEKMPDGRRFYRLNATVEMVGGGS